MKEATPTPLYVSMETSSCKAHTSRGSDALSDVDFEAFTDGRTTWVNTADGLIGRLGPRGIDVHGKPGDPVTCLDCGPLPKDPWRHFVAAMERHHGVRVPDDCCPEWAKHPQ